MMTFRGVHFRKPFLIIGVTDWMKEQMALLTPSLVTGRPQSSAFLEAV